MQTPEAVQALTPWITAGALVLLGADRGIAIFRALRGNGKKANGRLPIEIEDMAKQVNRDVRNALTVHQLTLDNSLLEWRSDIGDDIAAAVKESGNQVEKSHNLLLAAIKDRKR